MLKCERERGEKYAEHIWAAKLSALLNNLVPLADWLTGWLAGRKDKRTDGQTEGRTERERASGTDERLFVLAT